MILLVFAVLLILLFFFWNRARLRTQSKKDFLETVIKNLPIGICVKDPEKGFAFKTVNKRFTELLGFAGKNITGKHDSDLESKTFDPARCLAQDKSLIHTGATLDIIEEVAFPDRLRLFHVVKTPFTLADGKKFILNTFDEITDHHDMKQRHEEFIGRLNELLRAGRISYDFTCSVLLENDYVKSVRLLLEKIIRLTGAERAELYTPRFLHSRKMKCDFSYCKDSAELENTEKMIDFSFWKPSEDEEGIFFFSPDKEKYEVLSSKMALEPGKNFSIFLDGVKFPTDCVLFLVFPKEKSKLEILDIQLIRDAVSLYLKLRKRAGLPEPENEPEPVPEESETE